ncbi:MAG: molybdopterin-binding protein [Halovenus sp.]
MVDFQSRDTTRGTEAAETDEEEPPDEPASADESADSQSATAETPEQIDLSELCYAIVTVADDRSIAEDAQGDVVVEAIEEDDGTVTTRDLIQPSYDSVQSTTTRLTDRDDVDVVVVIGGTGIEPDDVTVEAVEPLFSKQLPGFGELFRLLAHEDKGTAIVGTRTTAGVIDNVPVFAVPGTIDGALLATDEIILPEAQSLVRDANGLDGSDRPDW